VSSTLEPLQMDRIERAALWFAGSMPLFSLVWEKRKWLGKVAGAGFAAATLLSFLIPPQYESTTQLVPPDQQPSAGISMLASMASGSLGSASGLASTLLSPKTPGAMFVAVLSSRTVQDDIINRLDLRRVYHTKRYMDARNKLARRTTIDQDRKSDVIKVTVADTDRYRARDIAAAYVDELNKHVDQLNASQAHQERVFLEGRLKEVKQNLDDATVELSEFSSKNATLDVQTQGKSMIEAAAQLQGEVIAAQSQLSGLQAIYTNDNVRVRSVQARINELQYQLRKLGGTDKGAEAGTSGADLKPDQLYPSIRELPLLGVKYYDLYRRAKIAEAVYESLTTEYETAKVQEARETPVIRVLDRPDVAEMRAYPPRLAIILIGTILVFFAGVGWLTGASLWSRIQDLFV
jgi:capsule polysaccharide export protein KpsE/RkpR